MSPGVKLDHRDRTDLIALSRGSQTARFRRACVYGAVEVLGGFKCIPPGTRPGWILRGRGQHGTDYFVAVEVEERTGTYKVRPLWCELGELPWKHWLGFDLGELPYYSIYRGDHPAKYTHYWSEAQCKVPIIS